MQILAMIVGAVVALTAVGLTQAAIAARERRKTTRELMARLISRARAVFEFLQRNKGQQPWPELHWQMRERFFDAYYEVELLAEGTKLFDQVELVGRSLTALAELTDRDSPQRWAAAIDDVSTTTNTLRAVSRSELTAPASWPRRLRTWAITAVRNLRHK